jgi:hypothetical protein
MDKRQNRILAYSAPCGGSIEPHFSLDYHAIQNDKLAFGKTSYIPASFERLFQLIKIRHCRGRFDALGHRVKFRAHASPFAFAIATHAASYA